MSQATLSKSYDPGQDVPALKKFKLAREIDKFIDPEPPVSQDKREALRDYHVPVANASPPVPRPVEWERAWERVTAVAMFERNIVSNYLNGRPPFRPAPVTVHVAPEELVIDEDAADLTETGLFAIGDDIARETLAAVDILPVLEKPKRDSRATVAARSRRKRTEEEILMQAQKVRREAKLNPLVRADPVALRKIIRSNRCRAKAKARAHTTLNA